ncbi:MAG: GAF domain-containing protein [Thermomicrobiales bacterium]|nr:GAF domain-containing protein [Thermomicrobiales bacterium]
MAAQSPPDHPEARQRLAALAAFAAVPYSSLDDAINAMLELLSDLIGISLTMIHRLEGDNLVVSHACDRIGLGLTLPVTVPRAYTFCDTVLASLAPLVIDDADRHEEWRSLPGKVAVGTRSYASVPIMLGNGRVFGTLCAHDRRVLKLGDSELDAMRILARLIAFEIERDEGLQRESAAAAHLARQNQDLHDALRQLDALREMVESISRHLDEQTLLQQVIESAVDLLGVHGGAISLVGETISAPRRMVATCNLGESDVATRPTPASAGLMGEVIARRGPVIVPAYRDVTDPLPDNAFHRLGPWIGVPIWSQDEIIGTFGVAANDPERVFGEREVTSLGLLAKHAAIGIENARLFAANHELGIAEERNRVAREMHDTLAQSLLTLTFQIRAARGLIPHDPADAEQELSAAETQARAALEEARRSVWNLGPAALESGSLLQAMQAEAATHFAGPEVAFSTSGTPRPLDADVQLATLRIMQEAVTNARRHSGCSRIAVHLDFGNEGVGLRVQDDGRGFDTSAPLSPGPAGGAGIPGMAERVKRLGGEFFIRSREQGSPGTLLCASVPYTRPATQSSGSARQSRGVVRILVVDDHPAIRAGLATLLDAELDLEVAGQAASGEEALRLIGELEPDIALIDLRLPGISGVETITRLSQLGSATRSIVVTSFQHDEMVLQALRAGAQGYLLKDATGRELATAVRTVKAGGTFLTPSVAGKLTGSLIRQERLTRRELQVLTLIGQGLADKEISAQIGATVKTVQFHVANVLGKLGAQNRTDAVRIAYARGILNI